MDSSDDRSILLMKFFFIFLQIIFMVNVHRMYRNNYRCHFDIYGINLFDELYLVEFLHTFSFFFFPVRTCGLVHGIN